MKRILLIAAIVMLALSAIGMVYSSNYSYVDDAGVLHDTLWMPISALGGLFAAAMWVILSLLYLVQAVRDRSEE